MKSILFIITLFVINFVNSQVIKIKAYEVSEIVGYDMNVIDAINSDSLSEYIRPTNAVYVIDLTNKNLEFYNNGILDTTCNILFTFNNGFYNINMLFDGYDIGLIVNPDIKNEQVFWYSNQGGYVEVDKFTKFEIEKGF